MVVPATLIIDSIEGDLAKIELDDKVFIDVPTSWLPAGIQEGDHIQVKVVGDGDVRFSIDKAGTQKAREQVQAAFDAVTTDPPEGFHI